MGQRHPTDAVDSYRKHVDGQRLREPVAHGDVIDFPVTFRYDEGHQHRLHPGASARYHFRLQYGWQALHGGIDFAEFDAITHDFHLGVLSADETQITFFIPVCQVARFIQSLTGFEWIGNEPLRCQVILAMVSEADACASDVKFPCQPMWQEIHLWIQDVKGCVLHRPADGDLPAFLAGSDPVDRRPDGYLRRAVGVVKSKPVCEPHGIRGSGVFPTGHEYAKREKGVGFQSTYHHWSHHCHRHPFFHYIGRKH